MTIALLQGWACELFGYVPIKCTRAVLDAPPALAAYFPDPEVQVEYLEALFVLQGFFLFWFCFDSSSIISVFLC